MAAQDVKAVRIRTACLQAMLDCIPEPPRSTVDSLARDIEAARAKAIESNDPNDEADYILSTVTMDDVISDHFRLCLESAVNERRKGTSPTKDPASHARDVVELVSAATGESSPWESSEDVLNDDSIRRFVDIKMLMDHHALGASDKCVNIIAEMAGGASISRIQPQEVEPNQEQSSDTDNFRADEFDITPPSER